MKELNRENISGVWSATPTPFTEDLQLDVDAVPRLVEHHLRLGVKGLFLGGTSGEGPWISDSMRIELAKETATANRERMLLAFQVTDNSAMRAIDNIKRIEDSGVDIAVIAPPFFQINASQEYLRDQYIEIIESSSLPVGVYHRGKHSSVMIETATLEEIIRHPKVILIKDSSGDPAARKMICAATRKCQDALFALNGDEFDSVPYAAAGYDGFLFGGACFNGFMANQIFKLAKAGDLQNAQAVQDHMNTIMTKVFGGKGIPCWLAGQKQIMVELGIFNTCRTIINYRITEEYSKIIKETVEQEKSYLLP
ncbi:MAG: dihydrodipicolinate synthase family protein [Victivallaceae bacterium]|nr:dihydrodipicolinate synthase family protein [Victivallaceae bacterium]